MIFWMARTSRQLSHQLRSEVDRAANAGRWALAVVALLAVGREGLETALFLWAATRAATAEGESNVEPLLGATLGLATALVLGYLVYRGAVRLNLSRFFAWSGGFLVIVAAGVLSYGVHDLQEARFLPGLNNLLFDVSDTIDPSSWFGTLLKGIFNFSPATTKLEAAVWLLYLVPVMVLFVRAIRRPVVQPVPAAAAGSLPISS